MAIEVPITEGQIRFYQENGYVQLLDVLTADERAQARAALDHVLAVKLDPQHDLSGRGENDKVFVQKINLWQVDAGMRDYVFNAKLAEIARRLAGITRLRLWHDQALVKMPGDSKPSMWHQDLPFWPMMDEGALTCWMAIDDVSEANGCMAFIPGSHRFGSLRPIQLFDPQPEDIFAQLPDEIRAGKDLTPVFQPMAAGSCTFHHGLTFHYAGANTTDRSRLAISTIYMPDGVRYNGRSHPVTDDLHLQPGDVLAGDRFPLLAEVREPTPTI